MLKISEVKRGKGLVLHLEGRIVGPWVNELRQICEPLISDGSNLSLNLAEVSFADENGISLLLSLQKRGANLLNETPFLKEQMKATASEQSPS
jgi:anti-anti-sigma regulatory factor